MPRYSQLLEGVPAQVGAQCARHASDARCTGEQARAEWRREQPTPRADGCGRGARRHSCRSDQRRRNPLQEEEYGREGHAWAPAAAQRGRRAVQVISSVCRLLEVSSRAHAIRAHHSCIVAVSVVSTCGSVSGYCAAGAHCRIRKRSQLELCILIDHCMRLEDAFNDNDSMIHNGQ